MVGNLKIESMAGSKTLGRGTGVTKEGNTIAVAECIGVDLGHRIRHRHISYIASDEGILFNGGHGAGQNHFVHIGVLEGKFCQGGNAFRHLIGSGKVSGIVQQPGHILAEQNIVHRAED